MTTPKFIQEIRIHTYCVVHSVAPEITPSEAGTFTIHMEPDPTLLHERVWSTGMQDWVKIDISLVAEILKYQSEFLRIVYEGPYIMFHFYFDNLYAKYLAYCIAPLDSYKDALILRCVEAGAPEPRPGLSF